MDAPSSRPTSEPHEGQTIEASFAWLAAGLERLALLAPIATPRQLLDLLPQATSEVQRLVLIELIKFDLAAARQAGRPRDLEFYWPTVGRVLKRCDLPFELIVEEVNLRRTAGETPLGEDYQRRFPELADTIGRWFASPEQNQMRSGPAGTLPELPVDSRIDDFFILQLLGRGTFARVYLARQESMQRLVALKVAPRGGEESQTLSQLDHPHIVRVYDQRQLHDPSVVLLYMQYLPGGTLAECIQHIRTLPSAEWNGEQLLHVVDQALLKASQSVPERSWIREQVAALQWPEVVSWIGIQLAEGLAHAHAFGVLHRDVKPANILLSSEAIPKLADFNVSSSGLSTSAGASAQFGGSLAYMSPEQLQVAASREPSRAGSLDGRSDLYALGILLWELWQGERPWKSEPTSNLSDALSQQQTLRSQPLTVFRDASSPAGRIVEQVLRDMLALERDARPASGQEVAARLKLALYPELAQRFEPQPHSLSGRLRRAPLLLVSALIVFVPNTAASIFNYFYNWFRMEELQPVITEIEVHFVAVANWVNGIVFPLGVALFLSVVWPILRTVRNARTGRVAAPRDIAELWTIGNRAALLGGVLWGVSGIIFAGVFASQHPEFGAADAFHFFISLVLCGGVAWIYPYFGMTLLAVLVYYPQVVAPNMLDPEFSRRCARLRLHSNYYLLSAAAIPLSAVALLVFRQSLPRAYVLAGAGLTLLGLLAAYFAHRKLDQTLHLFSKIFGEQDRSLLS